jgi:hypothetical protein
MSDDATDGRRRVRRDWPALVCPTATFGFGRQHWRKPRKAPFTQRCMASQASEARTFGCAPSWPRLCVIMFLGPCCLNGKRKLIDNDCPCQAEPAS